MLTTTDPEVMHNLIRSIDAKKMAECIHRRSLEEVAVMLEEGIVEDSESDSEVSSVITECEEGAEGLQCWTLATPDPNVQITPASDLKTREKSINFTEMVEGGDKEGLKRYLANEDMDVIEAVMHDLEDWQTQHQAHHMERLFSKLVPGKEFAEILLSRPELRNFAEHHMEQELAC